MPQDYLKGRNYLKWIRDGAKKAGENASSESERIFCMSLDASLGERLKNAIAPGDRRVIEQSISTAVVDGLKAIGRSWVVRKSYSLELPQLSLGKKEIDIAIESNGRLYLIEQKTILNFNSLGEVAFEGWCIKRGLRWQRGPYRFVGLFHHMYSVNEQKILDLAEEARQDGLLDAVFVLRAEEGRQGAVFKSLITDIKTFFQQG
ncbi:hypothetical protein [Pyxidicoccus caerfyrddinensis]|uniref:hypothetical protein n=1 Tax=Pyxidicoccus caerfyrddinensis TaxID=2709663 RepID=UPI0013DB62DF|nr:hypothetical protein [Pyxidicoccus caerfyrddinensis]